VRALTRAEARAAIVNVDPAEGKVRLPGHFDDLRWEELDYLGWRDPRAPSRAFLVADVDGRAVGALLRQSPSHAEVGSRAVMCALCRFSRRFNEVALFAAHRPSRDPRKRLSSVGLLLCTDLDCHRNVRTVRSGGPIDPPARRGRASSSGGPAGAYRRVPAHPDRRRPPGADEESLMAYLPRAERRDSIVAAAAAVVRRDGLGAVTARVVADELGGSPGQIHHHFASTDELVAEAWRRYADVEIVRFEDAARGRTARAALELFFEDLLGPAGDGQALARWAEAGAHAQLRPVVARAYVETLGLLTDVLADALGDRGDARRREAAGRLLMVGVGLAALTRVGGEQVVPPAAVMRSAIDAETACGD